MDELWNEIVSYFTAERVATLVRVVVVVVVGWFLARFLSSLAGRLAAARGGRHHDAVSKRLVRYGVMILVFLTVISELGFDLGVLLGAAGLLTVALGFAAQASTSNIISGAFLIGERAFEVGDVIMVGGTTGEVLAVDLMSVKLRTFDNLYVRLPNELVLKSEIRNLSRFPIRRLDIPLTIPYGVEFDEVKRILKAVATDHPYCLVEPPPLILFTDLSDRGYTVQYSVWAASARFVEVKGSIHAEVVSALGAHGIGIPMPRQAIYPGDPETAFAVRVDR